DVFPSRRAGNGEELRQRVRIHRTGEEKSLPELAPELFERAGLLGKLDSFRDDLEREARAERDDRRGQRAVFLRPDERSVHLENVDGETAEIAERRVARSEVVHRQPDPKRLALVQLQ